jgi:hypothetical protein
MKIVLIWLALLAGTIFYEKYCYKRAKRQGKKYYYSPISLKKYRIK